MHALLTHTTRHIQTLLDSTYDHQINTVPACQAMHVRVAFIAGWRSTAIFEHPILAQIPAGSNPLSTLTC